MGSAVQYDEDAIAIIGLSCRLPGEASTPQGFWDMLVNGRSAYTSGAKRWNAYAFHGSKSAGPRQGTTVANGAHYVDQDLARFDAAFFSISKHEAAAMDPQQRFMLELSYEALENAGLPIQSLAGSDMGVWVGSIFNDWREAFARDAEGAPKSYAATGSFIELLSNRVSWFYDLKGPSMTVNTACSSSMVALHLACTSLRNGECSAAMAAGVNLILNPDPSCYLGGQEFLSPDGKCKAFDASGNGYGRGEGCAVVVLKRVGDALRDGDAIRGVIRATGVNQDGRTKGITLPDTDAQASLIRATYRSAGLDLRETAYFEAHGTGTKAGDPIELGAIGQTLGAARANTSPPDAPLVVGSVKTNIGHTESVAGLAGVVKGVLMLENELIPPSLHFHNPNPAIPFDQWRVRVPTQLEPWPSSSPQQRMSVNSFGAGGTNAHAVLESKRSFLGDWTVQPQQQQPQQQRLFVLRSSDKAGIQRQKVAFRNHLERVKCDRKQADVENSESDYLAQLAYTLSERRSRLAWTSYAVGSTIDQLIASLSDSDDNKVKPLATNDADNPVNPKIAFVFSGQGAQWPTMGKDLLAFPAFYKSIAAADKHLRTVCGCPWSLLEELQRPKESSRINEAVIAHPVNVVLQVALVELLRSWNISPATVAGHSSGEGAAAFCAGAITREDVWSIAYAKGACMPLLHKLAPDTHGAMLAAGVTEEQAADLIAQAAEAGKGKVVAACLNSPSSITLSGDAEAITYMEQSLQRDGVFHRRLKIDHAYHSHHMLPLAGAYAENIERLGGIKGPAPDTTQSISMYSSSRENGAKVTWDELAVSAYWTGNMVSPVRFTNAVAEMVKHEKPDLIVEIGPHATLKGPVAQILKHYGLAEGVRNYHPTMLRGENGPMVAVSTAGALYAQNVPVDLGSINNNSCRALVPLTSLPSYAWNHDKSYWAEPRLNREHRLRAQPRRDLIGAPLPALSASDRTWRGYIRAQEEPWVADHRVLGDILYPAAGFLAMAIEGARQLADEARPSASIRTFCVRDFHISAPAVIPDLDDGTGSLEASIVMRPKARTAGETVHGAAAAGWLDFVISSRSAQDVESEFRQNCTGIIRIEYDEKPPADTGSATSSSYMAMELRAQGRDETNRFQALHDACTKPQSDKALYATLDKMGMQFGPTFRNLSELRTGKADDGRSSMTGLVCIPEYESSFSPVPVDGQQERKHIIHPTTLDAVIQCFFSATAAKELKTGMVPKRIDEVTVRACVPYNTGAKLKTAASASMHGMKDMVLDAIAVDELTLEPLITIKSMLLNPISIGADVSAAADRKLCFSMQWTPSLKHMTDLEITAWLDSCPRQERVAKLLEAAIKQKGKITVLDVAVGLEKVLSSSSPWLSKYVKLEVHGSEEDTLLTKDGGKYDLVFSSDDDFSRQLDLDTLLATDGKLALLNVDSLDIKISRSKVDTNSVMPQDATIHMIEAACPSEASSHFASLLQDALVSTCKVIRTQWDETRLFELVANGKKLHCIFLLDLEQAFLSSLTATKFELIRKLILSSRSSLWVSAVEGPFRGMVSGLARVLQNENAGSICRVVHIPSPTSTVDCDVQKLAHLVNLSEDDPEIEFRLFSSHNCQPTLEVLRIDEHAEKNTEIQEITTGQTKDVPLGTILDNTPVRLSVRTIGTLEGLRYEPVSDALFAAPLAEDEVEIDVRATGVNFRDVLTCMGEIPDASLGLEAAGVVIAAGAQSTLRPGARVCCMGAGAHQTRLRRPAGFCQELPADMSFEQGASMPVVFCTAYHALVNLARLRKGESVLIHAAAGGVGQAALQVAQHLGLEVFATVSPDKRALLRTQYGVPDDHIFHSRDLSFGLGVRRMTQGRGVDCILNSLAGEALAESWRCLATHGTFVEIGLKDILANSALDMKPFANNATYCFFNLQLMQQVKKSLMAEILEDTFRLVRSGVLKPVSPVDIYPASQAEKALRLMQAGKHRGKIVLSFDDADKATTLVPVLKTAEAMVRLNPQKTYVLVGGLGGLGRSLSSALVASGARNLCFLSRSGAASASAAELLRDIKAGGTNVQVISCDISNETAVASAIEQIQREMPPIGGVIQAAMVLQDGVFESMSFTQWTTSLKPKVQGSWNLHNCVPEDVDFFLMLSSFSAIFGNRGQANYAAGCAFQDELAHFRRSHGLKAASINLGGMLDVGVLAENGAAGDIASWMEHFGIHEREFHAIVLGAIEQQMRPDWADQDPQIITGLATGDAAHAAGVRPYFLDDPKFLVIAVQHSDDGPEGGSASGGQGEPLGAKLAKAESLADATEVVAMAILERLSRSLAIPVEEIDRRRPLYSYGIDSLVAMETRNWIIKELKSDVSLFDILANNPIQKLSEIIAQGSKLLSVEIDAKN